MGSVPIVDSPQRAILLDVLSILYIYIIQAYCFTLSLKVSILRIFIPCGFTIENSMILCSLETSLAER